MRQWNLPYCKANTTHTSLPANARLSTSATQSTSTSRRTAHLAATSYAIFIHIRVDHTVLRMINSNILHLQTFGNKFLELYLEFLPHSIVFLTGTTATSSRITRLSYSSQANSSIRPASLLCPLKCSFGTPRIWVQGSDFLNWKFFSSEELI